MGYGLGACIGAKVGRKDKTVVNIAGDGCFRMNMNEVAIATRYNIPIIEVIFNNTWYIEFDCFFKCFLKLLYCINTVSLSSHSF